jgi:hypothetical protein
MIFRRYQLINMARTFFFIECCAFLAIALTGCEHKEKAEVHDFTKADSLTETYLALQDTMLQVWNSMIYDDNKKIKAMHHLLHELSVINTSNREELDRLQERLDRLVNMRYDQDSMSDPELVTEYDFASSSLITELTSLAESQKEFLYNPTLQKLVDSIRAADQRVVSFREKYDQVALNFNTFIERNKELLQQIDSEAFEKKPLFQMAAE